MDGGTSKVRHLAAPNNGLHMKASDRRGARRYSCRCGAHFITTALPRQCLRATATSDDVRQDSPFIPACHRSISMLEVRKVSWTSAGQR